MVKANYQNAVFTAIFTQFRMAQPDQSPEAQVQRSTILRHLAAKALLEGRYTSFADIDMSNTPQARVLAHSEAISDRLKAVKQSAVMHMWQLAKEGKLPHRLEQYYFEKGEHDLIPYNAIWVPEDREIPPALARIGYRRETARPLREQSEQLKLAWKNPADFIARNSITIDGIACESLMVVREKIDRKNILDAIFKPLGYVKVAQGKGSVGTYEYKKPLAEGEEITCLFDFGTWRQTIDGHFIYRNGTYKLSFAFIYWPLAYALHGNIRSAPITTAELFTKTFDNIGFLAKMLECEHIPVFHKTIAQIVGS